MRITHFLPTRFVRRKWSDRYVTINEPLFPGYVFVCIPISSRYDVLRFRGAVEIVGGRDAWPISEQTIEAVRLAVEHRMRVEPFPDFQPGREALITQGPLKGFRGILINCDRIYKIVISVEIIGQSVAVEVDAAQVQTL